jgi:hypothetical protein
MEAFDWKRPLIFQEEIKVHTFIDIENYKEYILLKIIKNVSENSSVSVRFNTFIVLNLLVDILNRE